MVLCRILGARLSPGRSFGGRRAAREGRLQPGFAGIVCVRRVAPWRYKGGDGWTSSGSLRLGEACRWEGKTQRQGRLPTGERGAEHGDRSVLREVQGKKDHEGPDRGRDKERQAHHEGNLPRLWIHDLSNWSGQAGVSFYRGRAAPPIVGSVAVRRSLPGKKSPASCRPDFFSPAFIPSGMRTGVGRLGGVSFLLCCPSKAQRNAL